MFVVSKERVVEWPVDVEVPVDGGERAIHRFTAKFKLITQSEFDAVYRDGGNDVAMLRKVLVGVSDVQLEDGGIPTVEALADVPFVRVALTRAYVECATGARRKNLPTPPGDGRPGMPAGGATTAS